MDLKSGLIEINGEIFTPGYTFENFQKSTFFEGQDGVRIIRLNKTVQISGNNFITSLFFRNKIFSEEIKRKQFHDAILAKNGLSPETFFDWGNIKSVYDPKGNVSSINIIYNAGK